MAAAADTGGACSPALVTKARAPLALRLSATAIMVATRRTHSREASRVVHWEFGSCAFFRHCVRGGVIKRHRGAGSSPV